jgi:hypothetical protein
MQTTKDARRVGHQVAGLFVLCDRQRDRDNHSTVFAPVNDAFLGFSNLHRNGTDRTSLRRYKGLRFLLHTGYDRAK